MNANLAHVIPPELIALRQFVLWRYEDRGGPKPTKVPITAMGYNAKTNDPEHWSHCNYLEELLREHAGFAEGIGFVFSADDPFCGIDLDNVWLSDAAETPLWAEQICKRFGDTYLEKSPSGKGCKIWCRARLSSSGKQWPIEDGAIEIYDRGRFFVLTGRSNGVRVIADHQDDIDSLVAYMDGSASARPRPIGERISYGTQHRMLVSLAGTMWRRGMSVDAINAALQVTNTRQCERPGPAKNIRKIAESMTRYPR
jgi:primase-polymerase (primpol)-like protein